MPARASESGEVPTKTSYEFELTTVVQRSITELGQISIARTPGLIALIEGEHPSGRYKAQSVGREELAKPQGWLNLVLTTADYERTVAFYRDGLGYPVLERWDETGHGVMLDIGRATLEIADSEQAAEVDRIETGNVQGAPVRLALRVPDSRAVAEDLSAFGAQIVADVVQTPWKHINRRVIGPDRMPITLFQISGD